MTKIEMIDDNLLIKNCIKGKAKAQRELYEKYRSMWFMICLRYVQDREDALDILQNALVKIYTKMDQFDVNRGKFSTWSSRIVVNESIMFSRKKVKDLGLDQLHEDALLYAKEEEKIELLSAQELTRLVQELPEGYRLIFNLNVIEGYTHKEIAELLGITEGTSKSQLFKAKKLLKKKIQILVQSDERAIP